MLFRSALTDGAELWQLDLGEALVNSLAFGERELVVGGEKGTVFAVRGK